ncbi:MAG: V-type ATPase subunit [bacterium]
MDTRYAYAVGKIRALESRMITSSKMEMLAQVETMDVLIHELGDTEYADILSNSRDAHDLTEKLDNYLCNVYRMLRALSLDPEIIDIFLLAHDIENLKMLLKAGLNSSEVQVSPGPKGLFPPEELKQMVQRKNYAGLPALIADAAVHAPVEAKKNSDSQLIDIILDKAIYEYAMGVFVKHKNAFLKAVFEKKADLTNIKTFLRLKMRGKSKEMLGRLLVSGAKIPKDVFLILYESPAEDLFAKLATSDYGRLLNKVNDDFKKTGSLSVLETLFDDYILSFIQNAKSTVFGVEALAGYAFGKEYEVRNLRTIILAKAYGVNADSLGRAIRRSYV